MDAQTRALKIGKRRYALGRRAEQQAETRRRIVDAAIALHGDIGPAATTFSMVAERAGVQRHTLYAHFPDERSLLLACSGLHLERDPLPDAEPWRAIADRQDRLRTGLDSIYGWFERNAGHAACVLRDAEHHGPTREIAELRFRPALAAWLQVLCEGSPPGHIPMIVLAVSFHTWRTLVRDGGLGTAQAVESMVRAVESAAGTARTRTA